jgi:uncharacterized protein (TIRG00374 family)
MDKKVYSLLLQRTRRVIRWVLPVFVLYFVFKSIDLAQFKQNAVKTDPWLLVIGLLHAPVLILIGAFRWRSLLSLCYKKYISIRFILKHYWTGLALGFFAPASLGWDIYRVIVGGRRFGRYLLNFLVIVIEKIMALITCMSVIVILYPMLTMHVPPQIRKIFYLANILLFSALLLLMIILVGLRNRFFSLLLKKIENYVLNAFGKISARFGLENSFTGETFSVKPALEIFYNSRILIILVLSFGIQLVSAIKSQIFFNALGYDLPFLVNLFVAPTLYFIFLLPISFGSVGIREGVYILLYGLFGVPAEIALLVSFFNLAGMLLNNAIGGIVMFTAGTEKIERR